jgi:NAD(P)-dependent dehydrogenase (short-subunit alcohol dehydrogenase family)
MLFALAGKVALVTGSSRGIGRSCAEELARLGAKVIVSSRKAEACDEVVASIRTAGGEAVTIPCNVGRKDEVLALAERAVTAWGHVDVLVCNAAVNPAMGPMAGGTDEQFDKILTANVKSQLWLCNTLLPQMAARGGGSVIVLSSIAGLIGQKTIGLYGISKAADAALVRNLAVEWGRKGIRANAIAPGLIRTDMARALWENPATFEAACKASALGRIGEPREIAAAVCFLASDACRFLTGQTLVVDGGALIHDVFE